MKFNEKGLKKNIVHLVPKLLNVKVDMGIMQSALHERGIVLVIA